MPEFFAKQSEKICQEADELDERDEGSSHGQADPAADLGYIEKTYIIIS